MVILFNYQCPFLSSSLLNTYGEGGIWTLAPLLTTYSLSRGAPSATWVLLQEELIVKMLFLHLTEKVGFEPTAPFGVTGFQDRLLKPLGHLSLLSAFELYHWLFILSSTFLFFILLFLFYLALSQRQNIFYQSIFYLSTVFLTFFYFFISISNFPYFSRTLDMFFSFKILYFFLFLILFLMFVMLPFIHYMIFTAKIYFIRILLSFYLSFSP